VIWVLDASVAVRWFIEEENHPNADEVLRRILEEPGRFAVPELFAFEVFSVLLRVHPKGLDAFVHGVLPLLQSGILRYPMTEALATKAHRFGQRGLTGYDACYVALAQKLDGRWITFDSKAHQAIRQDRVSWDLDAGLPPGWTGQ
jgi:predicted nucleic acid-binding protein